MTKAEREKIKRYLLSGELAGMVAETVQGATISDSVGLWNHLKPYFASGDPSVERFVALFLDAKNHVLSLETLFSGTVSVAAVYPREVVKRGLALGAAAVIFAHNHPSGDPVPSVEDIRLTRQLIIACRVCGFTVHEHIIVGADRYHSLADHGCMATMNHAVETFINRGG